MWYVIQTMTGREEELVRMVRRILPRETYSDCFVAYYERIWRKQQQSLLHVERLFPGYVFILSDCPEDIFQMLKNVPAMSKLMSDGMFTFIPLEQGEEEFFTDMLDPSHIVRLSYVEKDGRGRVWRVTGPLKAHTDQVVRYQYKKRYALINVKVLGVVRQVVLGIILREDVRRELAYGKVETPSAQHLPERYEVETEPPEAVNLAVGDSVTVTSGSFAGMRGVIWKVRKASVDVGVRMFGQDMPMEVPVNAVCRAL